MNKEESEYKIRGVVGFMVKGQNRDRKRMRAGRPRTKECGRDVRDPRDARAVQQGFGYNPGVIILSSPTNQRLRREKTHKPRELVGTIDPRVRPVLEIDAGKHMGLPLQTLCNKGFMGSKKI